MVPLGAVGHPGLSSRDRLRWTLDLPVCVSAEHLYLRTNGGTILDLLSPRRPRFLLAGPPPPQLRASTGLGERSLGQAGGPRALVDRRDHSELQDLEAFIDLYFEMFLEQNKDSPELEEPSDVKTGDEEALWSINRKLSKLELLEEIQEELKELSSNLKHSWKLIEELREHKQDRNNSTQIQHGTED